MRGFSVRRLSQGFAICAVVAATLVGLPGQASAVSTSVVISQVYGGGGNTGAQFTNDFIELFNRGTTPADLTGRSVQYTSATGTANFGLTTNLLTELPSVVLAPGQYLLIQEAAGAGAGVPLPTPDVTD